MCSRNSPSRSKRERHRTIHPAMMRKVGHARFADLRTGTQGRDDMRDADGHVLDRLEAGLAGRPPVVDDRIEADVERLKIFDLASRLQSRVCTLTPGTRSGPFPSR